MPQALRRQKRESPPSWYSMRMLVFGSIATACIFFGVSLVMTRQPRHPATTSLAPVEITDGIPHPSAGLIDWKDADRVIAGFTGHPQLSRYMQRLRGDLPGIRQRIEQAFAKGQGLHIDYIAALHGGGEETPAQEAETRRNQQQVSTLFNELNPDVIGVEGMPADRLTRTSFIDEIRHEARDRGATYSEEEYAEIPDLLATLDGGIRYWLEHPGKRTIGLEEQSLHDAHFNALTQAPAMLVTDEKYMELLTLLSIMRSHVAVARMINAVHSIPGDRALFQFGADHRSDITGIFYQVGVRSRIYDVSR